MKKHLPLLISVAVGFILFSVSHHFATLDRGYAAIGGEIFLLFMPVYVYAVRALPKR